MSKSIWGKEEIETLDLIKNLHLSGNTLNLCCGDGRFNTALLQTSYVTALDCDKLAIKALLKNTPQKFREKLKVVTADITDQFPFQPNSFDNIFCTGALHIFELNTLSCIIKEIERVLKPNGNLIIDFATDILHIDINNNLVKVANIEYTEQSAKKLLKKLLKNFNLKIESYLFEDNDIKNNPLYTQIKGKFLLINGKKIK